jgi:hypothetical protein
MNCPICTNNYYVSNNTETETNTETNTETETETETETNTDLISNQETCTYICDTGLQCKLKSVHEDLCNMHIIYRTKIVCPSCNFDCCKICYKTYFLQSNEEPMCMAEKCRKGFSVEFMLGYDGYIQRFSSKFVWGPLKEHREDILLDQIMARLPTFQLIVTEQISNEKFKEKITKIDQRIKDIHIQNTEIIRNIIVYEEFGIACKELCKTVNNNRHRLSKLAELRILTYINSTNKDKNKEHKEHKTHGQCLRKVNGCNGFINHEWECGVCFTKVCSKCHSLKEKNHECDPNEVESIKVLKEISKACPGCNQMIERSHGCFAVNTKILLYNGDIKMSQDIQVGDILVGDDGNKRTVQKCVSGTDDMYRIIQNNGENYTVNSKHTLVLIDKNNDQVQIVVDDYLKLSEFKKSQLYGIKSSNGINYCEQIIKIDPYMLGLWLGDGTHTHPVIASNDFEIQMYLLEQLKLYNLIGNKHIPKEFLMNSRENRLKLLAGLIDTDGTLSKEKKIAIIIQTKPVLSEQIILLARSLGFVVNVQIRERKNESIFGGSKKDYKDQYLINISGDKLSEIPTLLPRKKCINSKSNKNQFKTSINVEYLGRDKYFGWQVDKNSLYIARDMTILRNCSQMWCTNCHNFFDWNTCKLIKKTEYTHNPEHVAWLTKNRNVLGNINGNDNNVCNIDFVQISRLDIQLSAKEILNENLRICNEIREDINGYVNPLENNIEKHAIEFLRGKINKNDLKKLVQRNYKASKKTEFANMYRSMYIDNVRDILVFAVKEIKNVSKKISLSDSIAQIDIILQNTFLVLNNLKEYTENNLKNLGVLFNSEKPHLSNITFRAQIYKNRLVNNFVKDFSTLKIREYKMSYRIRNILNILTNTLTEKELIIFLTTNPDWVPDKKDILIEMNKIY